MQTAPNVLISISDMAHVRNGLKPSARQLVASGSPRPCRQLRYQLSRLPLVPSETSLPSGAEELGIELSQTLLSRRDQISFPPG
jgi:hypothetical protein